MTKLTFFSTAKKRDRMEMLKLLVKALKAVHVHVPQVGHGGYQKGGTLT